MHVHDYRPPKSIAIAIAYLGHYQAKGQNSIRYQIIFMPTPHPPLRNSAISHFACTGSEQKGFFF